MAHNNNIKTFEMISNPLKIEDERQKSLAPPSVELVSKEVGVRAKGPIMENRPRKVHILFKTLDLGKVLPRSIRLRAMETRI